MTTGHDGAERGGIGFRLVRRLIDARPDEMSALGWSWLFYFSVLSAYYVIRPIRDEMGVAGGVDNLPWLFTGTLIGMMIANPPFAALVSRFPALTFISATYRFFIANLLIFFFLLLNASAVESIWVGRVFFIWTSVFNLFVVSIFWACMVDVFTTEQGKRLFGFIAAGATLGAITGSSLTAGLVYVIGPTYLLLVSCALLELAVFSVRRVARVSGALSRGQLAIERDTRIGGGVMAGLTHTLKSPYLLNISLYMLLFTVTSTFLYFQQADIVDRTFTDRTARTAFFAQVDLLVNVLTLGTQLFLTGRIVGALGIAVTLTLLPLLSIAGFLTLGMAPTIAAIVVFQALRRAGNYAVARPTREVLYTVLSREDKYKAKSFIDTFVYRAGDQVGAWSYALLAALGLGVSGVALAAVPVSVAWAVNALWLGRRQEALAPTRADERPDPRSARAVLAGK